MRIGKQYHLFCGRLPRSYGRPSLPAPLTQVPGFELSTADTHTILHESCQRNRLQSSQLQRAQTAPPRQFSCKSPQKSLENQREVKARYNFRNLKKDRPCLKF